MADESIEPARIHAISEQRFNAHVVWARGAGPVVPIKEVEWLEIKPGRVLGTLFVDLTDQELHSAVIAPDLAGRYRAVDILGPHSNVREAAHKTAESMARVHNDYDAERAQGDEKASENFFAAAANESKLHTRYTYLRDQTSAVAARRLIEIAMRWYENQDGTFVEQFQTTAFDARIWELYLWAMLRESGFRVDQPKPAPDFLARGLLGDFYVEATTANPPPADKVVPLPRSEEAIFDYVHNYLPTRFSGPLDAKLRKRYWERAGAEAIPFVIAVQDFHQDLSMTWSQSALYEYLYGVRIDEVESNGKVQKVEVPVADLKWGDKKLPSGFFKLPDSEHISAVAFNAAGTLSKFNRMGIAAGFGDSSVTAQHEGTRFSKDNTGETQRFSQPVTEESEEDWIDGLTVFHNPNALHPLPFEGLPGAAHVFEENGIRTQFAPAGHLVSSTTKLIVRVGSA
ncbi:hypothetical protein DEA06_06760 [Microbacterium sp. Gd 4-13]|uniref:hypothetical protein n=1 Tax=Microbacterium sp. Gd 4-13 TaxID=2173179 RepID=UPI000D573C33|nr:hypothetical protein [Microbacterium sp. Gd 4-13]PVW05434.1 hypothetical protein DEA06_06760 [Microbacterium sp. Gd 4-13]